METRIKDYIKSRFITSNMAFWDMLFAFNKNRTATTDSMWLAFTGMNADLSSKILKIANLPFFNAGRPLRSIDEAMSMLGLNRLTSIAIGVMAMEMFPAITPGTEKVWAHNYEVAFIAEVTFDRNPIGQQFFLAGLLHDIGKVILSYFSPDYLCEIYGLHGKDLIKCEKGLFGCTHAEVGAWFIEAANLPAEVAFAVRHHQDALFEFGTERTDLLQAVINSEALSKLFLSDFNIDNGEFCLLSVDHLIYLGEIVKKARMHSYDFSANHNSRLITKEEADFLLASLSSNTQTEEYTPL